jgi:hypothetical protein
MIKEKNRLARFAFLDCWAMGRDCNRNSAFEGAHHSRLVAQPPSAAKIASAIRHFKKLIKELNGTLDGPPTLLAKLLWNLSLIFKGLKGLKGLKMSHGHGQGRQDRQRRPPKKGARPPNKIG